ncbi:hypothetical protein LEN26_009293 [Aphanomyces euteiches]|nr:hypothetical protein LEN26_009293 [Aphanomyces euteiches]
MATTEQFHAIDTPKSQFGLGDKALQLRNVPKLSIEWKIDELSVQINKGRGPTETKTILKNVNGAVSAGELVVIMGPSGAGKSFMLDIIAGRNKNFTGHVTVNGRPWNKALNQRACYVMQDDIFYHTLTVQEHLQFQAELRMGKAYTTAERNERVQYVIDELGLRKCKDSQIGSATVRGISGGERKRLSFATELLTNPSLLFVDEPTSGLDSFMAESIVQQMQQLAQEGRTILTTIHQPSSDLFALFDSLYLLSNGRTIYHGKAVDSVAYFASIGYQCPNYMNPTDCFMKQIIQLDPEATKRVDGMVSLWSDNEATIFKPTLDFASMEELATYTDARLSTWNQFAVLCKRNVTRLVRDQMAFRARFFQSIFIAMVVGLIYLQLDMSQKAVQSFSGVLFFMTINQVIGPSNAEFLGVPLELPIMARETSASFRSKSSFRWFFFFRYFMVGFGASDAGLFFTFYGYMVLLNSAATGLGYMVGCMVRRVDLAPIIGVVIVLPLILFGGLFINADDMPAYYIWLEYISPLKFAYRGLMRAFWSTITTIPCSADVATCVHSGFQVLQNNSLDTASVAVDIVALLGINVSFRLLGTIFLAKSVAQRD